MFGKTIRCREIEGKCLVLKAYGKDAVPRMTDWVNDPEITRYLGTNSALSLEQEERWYEKIAEADDKCQWGIFWDGEHIGNAGIDKIDSIDLNAFYGVLIGERSAWGKGIGTEVAKQIATYGFLTLNLEHIYADVYLPNEGSKIALERAGYKECGRRPGAKFINGEYCVNWQCYLSRSEWAEAQKGTADAA